MYFLLARVVPMVSSCTLYRREIVISSHSVANGFGILLQGFSVGLLRIFRAAVSQVSYTIPNHFPKKLMLGVGNRLEFTLIAFIFSKTQLTLKYSTFSPISRVSEWIKKKTKTKTTGCSVFPVFSVVDILENFGRFRYICSYFIDHHCRKITFIHTRIQKSKYEIWIKTRRNSLRTMHIPRPAADKPRFTGTITPGFLPSMTSRPMRSVRSSSWTGVQRSTAYSLCKMWIVIRLNRQLSNCHEHRTTSSESWSTTRRP